MKHLFILNPVAGKYNHSAEFTKKIAAVCKPRGLDYETKISAYKGNCTELARAAAETGEPVHIYACGGDGTLNEVVNGAAGFPNAAVTHFPGGSGNDFIRIFSDYAAFSDLERLLDYEETEFDLIDVNGQTLCLNICSMGVDARITEDTPRIRRLPAISGPGAYNLSTAFNLVKGIHRPCEVEMDGKSFSGEMTLVAICSGRYYGGGFNPMPDAEPDDGLLDVLLISRVGLLTAARVIGDFKAGLYALHPEYCTHCRTKALTVRCKENSPINVDGEILHGQEVHFALSPKKARFFYPRGLTYHL